MLARLSGVWKILRIERGKNYAWNGSFVSAEDALASIDGHELRHYPGPTRLESRR